MLPIRLEFVRMSPQDYGVINTNFAPCWKCGDPMSALQAVQGHI